MQQWILGVVAAGGLGAAAMGDVVNVMVAGLAVGSVALPAFGQPNAPGFVIETYAELCEPVKLSFAKEGVLFSGNGGCGGPLGGPAWVRRVALGGSPVENYGQSMLTDPDPVLVDNDGLLSPVGSVLCGGGGVISAILPDESITTLLDSGSIGNPTELAFDNEGRLLILQLNPALVSVSTSGEPPVTLFNLGIPGGRGLAVDGVDRIYTTAQDGVIRIHNPDGSVFDNALVTGLGTEIPLEFGPGGAFGTDLYAVAGSLPPAEAVQR